MTADARTLPILLVQGVGHLGGPVTFHLLDDEGQTQLVDRRDGPRPGDDLATLVEEVAAAGARFQDVIVDLEPVKWLNSTGLGWLVGLNRRRKTEGDDVVLACVGDRVAKLLHTTSLDLALRSFETVATAAEALRSGE